MGRWNFKNNNQAANGNCEYCHQVTEYLEGNKLAYNKPKKN